MTIFLGGTEIVDIKLGSIQIAEVYSGADLVWAADTNDVTLNIASAEGATVPDIYVGGDTATQYGWSDGFPGSALPQHQAYGSDSGNFDGNVIQDCAVLRQADGFTDKADLFLHVKSGTMFNGNFTLVISGKSFSTSTPLADSIVNIGGVNYRELQWQAVRTTYDVDPINWVNVTAAINYF